MAHFKHLAALLGISPHRRNASIQIDMFEVQLGAAILLQFYTEGKTVRVLADAGIKASGYPKTHIRDKILPILDKSGSRHIDLVIGTHYDEDHLAGLVPIIEDETITFGEAWMPPIANDSQENALDAPLANRKLLPHQFYQDGDLETLNNYLLSKQADIETVQAFLEEDDGIAREHLARWQARHSEDLDTSLRLQTNAEISANDLAYFRRYVTRSDPHHCNHGTEQEVEPPPELEDAISNARKLSYGTPRWIAENSREQLDLFHYMRTALPRASKAQQKSLKNIAESAAKDAINAAALQKVVKALKGRQIPIRTEVIPDGKPRRYEWDGVYFRPSEKGNRSPSLKLLGPSRSLVKKHWHRLPVEQSTKVALSFLREIKSITPSNQLSYVARFSHAEQGILISGDAGCVDFKQRRDAYYADLLKSLLPLHVIQVAHHAGANAHFYRVLEACGYPEQQDRSVLLISHATLDKHRPSEEFREFLLRTLKKGDDVQLLFTSKPQPEKSKDFTKAFHPVVGASSEKGDVSLSFINRKWRVDSHAVEP